MSEAGEVMEITGLNRQYIAVGLTKYSVKPEKWILWIVELYTVLHGTIANELALLVSVYVYA